MFLITDPFKKGADLQLDLHHNLTVSCKGLPSDIGLSFGSGQRLKAKPSPGQLPALLTTTWESLRDLALSSLSNLISFTPFPGSSHICLLGPASGPLHMMFPLLIMHPSPTRCLQYTMVSMMRRKI